LVQPPALANATGSPDVAVATTVKLLFSVAVGGAGVVTVMLCDAIVAFTLSGVADADE
jgi:hypothetical protein